MPREGVPYPERVLCSLKNTIAMIEQKLGLKIEKVNGVGPDPQGNVTLVSGDSALTIDEDAAQHQITVGLDRAELPAAMVTSVNGETGAVVLNASEIESSGSSDVQTDINALKAADVTLQGNINAEATARGNADAALQTNINTVTATLPSIAAAAVANNPDIAQLQYDVTNLQNQKANKTGNEILTGIKQFASPIGGGFIITAGNLINTNNFIKIAQVRAYSQIHFRLYAMAPNNGLGYAEFLMGGSGPYNRSYKLFSFGIFSGATFLRIGKGNYQDLWVKLSSPSSANIRLIAYNTTTAITADNVIYDTTLSTAPSIGDTDPVTGESIDGVSTIS